MAGGRGQGREGAPTRNMAARQAVRVFAFCVTSLSATLLTAGCNDPSGPSPPDQPQLICPAPVAATGDFTVASPNGGEVFRIGDPCTVAVCGLRSRRLGVALLFGAYSFQLPGVIKTITPGSDTTIVFTVPDHFDEAVWNDAKGDFDTTRVSPVSDSCRVKVMDYGSPAICDYSDCFFSIRP